MPVCCRLAEETPPSSLMTLSNFRRALLRGLLLGGPLALVCGLIHPLAALVGVVVGLSAVPVSIVELWAERFPGNRGGASAFALFVLFWVMSGYGLALLAFNTGYAVASFQGGHGPDAVLESLSVLGSLGPLVPVVVAFFSWVIALASFNRVRRREREPLFDTFMVALASGGSFGVVISLLLLLGTKSMFLAFGMFALTLILVAVATYSSVLVLYAYFWADWLAERFGSAED